MLDSVERMVLQNEDDLQVDLLENAVFQQLLSGTERMMGRYTEYTMQLKGIEILLRKFIEKIKNNLSKLREGKIHSFLETYEKHYGIDLSDTESRIMENFENSGGIEAARAEPTFLYYMVLTKLLEELREFSFQKYGFERLLTEVQKSDSKMNKDKLEDLLNNLAGKGNKDLSLLYNLGFIALLAADFGDKPYRIKIKKLITLRINRIISKLNL